MVEARSNEQITTAEFSAKFRSKYEVYQFMTIDAKAYLPAPECLTIYFLKDLIRGAKSCKFSFFISNIDIVIKSDEAKHLHVPLYEGLSVENILSKGMTYEQVRTHMPD